MDKDNDPLHYLLTLPPQELAAQLTTLHFADAIDLINACELDECVDIINRLDLGYAIELFDKPELQNREELLENLPAEKAKAILDGMSADEAKNVFQKMDSTAQKYLFALLSPVTRAEINKLRDYPDSSAGSLMTTEFITVPSTWSVETTLAHIRDVEHTRETVYSSYVIDPHTGELLRAISLRNLILADGKENILTAARGEQPIAISPYTDREDVARLFRRHDLLAVPVVDGGNHVIGIVTVDDVLDSMAQEMSEDTYKFGGMEALDKPYTHISFFEMFKKRAGWLCALFISEMLTASAMQYFNSELEKATVLSLFIPLIMSSGGNSGSQATSLVIRSLALRELKIKDWFSVALRELPTGVALGSLLGIIIVIRILLWQFSGFYNYGEHFMLIAISVCLSLVGVVTFGSLTGSMLPFLLKRFGFDPASASAPFVATLVDVTGLVIYFSIAMVVMRGTLL
ncbi:magnesium transporter [Bartonella sp. TP]|uniref:magnesium transporter n=1 Tax=Bartonella sp. TP TaxID=3057550 RepID=UPI0025B0C5A6|nr:magnesium transporter [Bartonella sp. TP]MDN5248964.1 magnesium transporter [Alphaproteobacteria bacterium]WJW80239.1 magnesium transporter [Bartonella sp. TP]